MSPPETSSDLTLSPPRLTWGLAVATYNRADVLLKTVEYALNQSRPPVEVVICDSSADWETTAARVRQLVDRLRPEVRLRYLPSPAAQQTIQRNVALDNAAADVLFMIDDDAFLSREAAEKVLRVYEADGRKEVVAVAPEPMREWSFEAATAAASGDASDAVHRAPWTARLLNRLLSGAVNARPLRPKPFDLPRVEGLPLRPATFLEGYRITVRREVIARLRFDESLVSGLFEDGDASHRLAETGGMVIIERPLIFHAAAPRPAVEGRRGILNRFGWILHLAYLNRKYYGSGWYVRWIGVSHWLRWVPVDFATGIVRRDFSRLRGCFAVLPALIKLTLAPQEKIGQIVVDESRAIKTRLQKA